MEFVYSEVGEGVSQSFIHGMLEWDELRRLSWPPGQHLVYKGGRLAHGQLRVRVSYAVGNVRGRVPGYEQGLGALCRIAP
jgi:hypothetical protein